METTKWVALAAGIRQSINTGKYPQGKPLPPTKTLATKHGVARNTMARALTALADDGVLTYSGPPPQYVVNETGAGAITGQNAMLRAKQGGTIHATGTYCTFPTPEERVKCPNWAAKHLGLEPGDWCRRRVRVHHRASGVVYQASEQLITEEHADLLPELRSGERVTRGVWALLADRLGIEPARARERNTVVINHEMALLLGVHHELRLLRCEVTIEGSDGTTLSCTRRYSTGDEPLTYETEL